jgi:hypothetical protein
VLEGYFVLKESVAHEPIQLRTLVDNGNSHS